jgi:hypothetical protein
MIRNNARKDSMRRAVEATEEYKAEQLLYFDLIFIQTSACSVHVEQDIKNKAHPKGDEEIKSVSVM